MDSIHDLMICVEDEAVARNYEVIASALANAEHYPNVCEWGKIWWHLKSLGRSFQKINTRISESEKDCPYNRYLKKFNHKDSKLDTMEQLLSRKEELTQEIKNDNITLGNLTRCEKCNACKYVHSDQEYLIVMSMNKGWRIYTVQELREKSVGTVFEHQTLGQCWIESSGSGSGKCMTFQNGSKAYFSQSDVDPWNIAMRENSSFMFICEGEEGQ